MGNNATLQGGFEVYLIICVIYGLPGGSEVKNPPVVHEPQETRVQPLGWEDPLEEGLATHSSILTWRIPMGRGAWWTTVHEISGLDTTEVT